MEMSGEHTIAASRQTVWEALNDPEILKQCIPGCEEIEQTEDNAFAAKVKAKVGPVNARFSGNVTLSNLNPPESYTISGEGSGGAAGFAKGGADVQLEEIDAEQTKLSYQVKAQVGGKLAQLGQRLIKSTADKYAKQFFDKFEEIVGGGQSQAAESEAESEAEADAQASGSNADASASGDTATSTAAAAAGGDASSAQGQATGVAGAGGTEAAAQNPAEASPAAKSDDAAAQSGARTAARSGDGGGQPAESAGGGLSPKVWIGALIAAVAVLVVVLLA